jgi:hypothetical protein
MTAPLHSKRATSNTRTRWLGAFGAAVVVAGFAASSAMASGTTYRATPSSMGSCPSTKAAVPNKDDFVTNASNTTFQSSGNSWNQKAGVDDYTVKFNASSGTGDCYIGGKIQGTNAMSKTWSNLKGCCNGAGVFAYHDLSVWNVRMDNIAVDDFRLLNKDGNNSYFVGGSHLIDTRDDCFSTGHGALTVNDTLAECYTVVSWRHTGNENTAFPVTFTNDLFYLKPQLSGSEDRCPSQMSGGMGSGQIWKMDDFHGSSSLVHVTNTIFRVDQGNDNACDLAWVNGTFTNDTLVWTGKGTYPGKLPAGVKLTTDKSIWTNAVNKWMSNHPGM